MSLLGTEEFRFGSVLLWSDLPGRSWVLIPLCVLPLMEKGSVNQSDVVVPMVKGGLPPVRAHREELPAAVFVGTEYSLRLCF